MPYRSPVKKDKPKRRVMQKLRTTDDHTTTLTLENLKTHEQDSQNSSNVKIKVKEYMKKNNKFKTIEVHDDINLDSSKLSNSRG